VKTFYNFTPEFKVFVKQENGSLVCRNKNAKTIKGFSVQPESEMKKMK